MRQLHARLRQGGRQHGVIVRDNSGKPFFLYLPHSFPHVPLFASDKFRNGSPRGLHGDVVEELDWSVGEILKALRELDLDRRTLVIFTSDNGPGLTQDLAGGSAGLLREGKGSTSEGGMRVPMIARWPGRIPEGRVSHELACSMDLFPTLAALAGAVPPPDRMIDGLNIANERPADLAEIRALADWRLATVQPVKSQLEELAAP